MEKRGRKAQVTLFIILAIIIVAVLIFVFNSRIRTAVSEIFVSSKPTVKLQECILSDLKETMQEISLSGGSVEPVNYLKYQDDEIEYLCFTNEYYKTCVNQQPLLKEHFERELLDQMRPTIDSCVAKMKQDFRDKGYNVQEGRQDVTISLEPNKVKFEVSGISVTKDSSSEKYNDFSISQKSKMYNLIMMSNSIVSWEAKYGDAEIMNYMLYYPSVKVEKLRQSDGSKIYTLTDGNEEFRFATRSLAWPPGYNLKDSIYTPIR